VSVALATAPLLAELCAIELRAATAAGCRRAAVLRQQIRDIEAAYALRRRRPE